MKRPWVVLKLSCAFAAGWLLALLLFAAEDLNHSLIAPAWPALSGIGFLKGDYDMAAMCFGITLLTLASITFAIVTLRLVGLAYVMIALYWMWVYSLLAIPF